MPKRIFLSLFLFFFIFSPVFAQEEISKEKPESKISSGLSFKEGTFLGDLKTKADELFNQIETWREAQQKSFKASLEKIEKERSAKKDERTATKAITTIHLAILAVLLFIFSIQIAFYVVLFGVVFFIVKKIFSFIFGLFRRKSGRV